MPELNLANQQVIHYKLIEGNSELPTLVFLHEGLGCIEMWKDFPDRLCRETGCPGLVYDRIGYGKSSAITGSRNANYLHQFALVELPMVLNAILPDIPYILVGHSDGASIALIYAAQQHHLLVGVVSMAAHVVVEGETIAGIEQAELAWHANKLTNLHRYHGEKTESMFKAWSVTWLQPHFKLWDITGLLPSINVPILALQGEDDQYATAKQIDLIVERTAGKAEGHIVEYCAHSPHLQAEPQVISLISNFISEMT